MNPKDYIRLFRVDSFPFLAGEFWIRGYKEIGVIYTSRDRIRISYLPKSRLAETAKEGREIYGSQKNYKKFKKIWYDYTKRVESFFNKVPKKLSKPNIEEFNKLMDEFFVHYGRTEFIFVDAGKKLNTEESEKIMADFGDFKKSARRFVNKVFLGSESYFYKFIPKLSKQFDVPFDIIMDYSPDELLELFDGKRVPQDKITERRGNYINGESPVFGKKAEKILKKFYPKETAKNSFKGIIVNKGYAKAPVWVIYQTFGEYDSLKKIIADMPQGNVLLTETTSPDLIIACKRACAIITDQGGLMSHAAVVSRELNIPCIVGLKDAMNFIKDNDLVEVDANKGVVRILKK